MVSKSKEGYIIMAKNKTNDNMEVKDRILDASEDLFSSKGYDATSMEQIAKKAEVTKSLIYYYFESKEKILEELISKYMVTTMKEKRDVLLSNQSNTSIIEQSMQKGFDFLFKNKRIMRILITEMLKDNIRNNNLCKMVGDMITASAANLKSLGMDIKDDDEFAMYSFFFGLIPIIAFMHLGDTWMKNNQLDSNLFTQKFAKMARASFSNDITGLKSEHLEPLDTVVAESLNKLL